MKIAIICSSFFPVIDGVTIAIFHRVKYLSQLKHKVLLFCPDYSKINHIYPDWRDYTGEILPGIEVVSLASTKSIALEFERDVTIRSYSTVIKELENFRPDLIHVDEAERLAFCFLKRSGIRFAKQHNIPCIAWFHTNYIDYFDDYFSLPLGANQLVKNILSMAFTKIYNSYDLTLVSSLETQHKLEKMGIKNLRYGELLGCDLESFDRSCKNTNFATNKYDLPELKNKVKLIFIGRLTPDKGWSFCLKSLVKLPPNILAKIAVIVIGEGDLKVAINSTLKSLITDTYLLGRVSPQDIPQLLINSDIFITNSEKETKGLTVIEAAAAGIPAIAPRAGGVVDTIIDRETGFLYEPQNQADFLDKLTTLIEDRALRKSMGAKAKSLANEWNWQKTTDNLIKIWTEQINK
ncbi:MAG: glycosyltransferase [Cyanobacteria bacterium P01_G01_bin.19]